MSIVLLETRRDYNVIYYYRIKEFWIKLVIEASLYYDARSENIKKTSTVVSSRSEYLKERKPFRKFMVKNCGIININTEILHYTAKY
jgi:hypothetical protein